MRRWSLAALALPLIVGASSRAAADTYPRQPGVDAIHYVFRLDLTDASNEITGQSTVTFRFASAGIREVMLDLVRTTDDGKGMTISSVTNQPEAQEGRYRKRHVRASFPGTSLRQAVRLMTDIESAPYPIAIERVHIEHFQEGDHYNVELGVITARHADVRQRA